jgi:hypothetical protein
MTEAIRASSNYALRSTEMTANDRSQTWRRDIVAMDYEVLLLKMTMS